MEGENKGPAATGIASGVEAHVGPVNSNLRVRTKQWRSSAAHISGIHKLRVDTNESKEQFRDAILRAGLTPPDVIEPDGKLHRFSTNGKPRDDAGWYVLYTDGFPVGIFGDWRTGVKEKWTASDGRRPSRQEKYQNLGRMTAMRSARVADEASRKKEARNKAKTIWENAEAAPDDHPYLLAKGVKPYGLRVHEGWLVVPMYDGTDLHNLQRISVDGKKRFLIGGRVNGCYFIIGKPDAVLCIAEGFATAASVHAATGHAVAVAFNAGNLVAVAQSLRGKSPGLRLILCADDDINSPENPGLNKARMAAQTVGGILALPDFGSNRPATATDFNDLQRHAGLGAIRGCIEGDGALPENEVEQVVYRRLSEVQMQPIRWLWRGRFARGKVSMIAGHPGLGKSQVTASMAAIVTTGGHWPLDGSQSDIGNVIFLSAEDDPADTILPRLLAAGADTGRCYMLDAVREVDGDGAARNRTFNLQADLDRLEELLGRIGNVALVVIDPVSAYLGGADSHKNADIRGVFAPLSDMAARLGVAIVCISHLNKGGGNEALMRVTGSLAFVAVARAAYLVAGDKEDHQRRLFVPLKNNIGNDQLGLAFRLESCDLGADILTSRVAWEDAPVTVTADEAMRRPGQSDDEERTLRDDIAEWLQDLLYPGRMKSQEMQAQAKQAGFAWRTVQRVANATGIVMEREGFGPATATYWSLAAVPPDDNSRANIEALARLGAPGASDEFEQNEL